MEATNSLDYLPFAIWMHILTLLPVKSLLILRPVCRFFLNLIDDSEFVAFYRRNNPTNLQENRILTLQFRYHPEHEAHCGKCAIPYPQHLTHCEVLEHESNAPNAELKWIEPSSFCNKARQWIVEGSLDGLLLVKGDNFVMIWNPSIRKTRPIPSPMDTPAHSLTFERFGLGYDESCNEYKILTMEDDGSKAWVYSVKTGSWTTVSLPTCGHKKETSGSVAFKSGLLWIEGVDTGHSYYHHLVRFDFVTENFRYISLPYPIKENLWITNRFVMVDGGGSLGVVGLDSKHLLSLWVMDANATVTSWTKMYNFGEGVQQMRAFRNKEMVWEYWTKSARLKPSLYVDEHLNDRVEFVDAYVESLVLV